MEVEIVERVIAKKQVGESCVICEQIRPAGIHLYTSFICTDCEQTMIQTETSDPKYKYYVDKLRKVNKPEIYS
ncbi:CsfB [Mesobacillus campisalis]|uniref:CsfB n=1 Tax=Mesobacillus campisalis TaxID=1408103 RepID=A0A0M2SSL9_9BACI|nr:CsfB [Mesobacillus campisalis]